MKTCRPERNKNEVSDLHADAVHHLIGLAGKFARASEPSGPNNFTSLRGTNEANAIGLGYHTRLVSAWEGHAMDLFVFLHDVASLRNDGLHPELLRLFRQRAALSGPTVGKLQSRGPLSGKQAGPNPCRMSNRRLPKDVIRFPRKAKSTVRGL